MTDDQYCENISMEHLNECEKCDRIFLKIYNAAADEVLNNSSKDIDDNYISKSIVLELLEIILRDCLVDVEEFLKSLIEENRNNGRKCLYGCPYCSYKSWSFHLVVLHISIKQSCSDRHEVNPCYPINLSENQGECM